MLRNTVRKMAEERNTTQNIKPSGICQAHLIVVIQRTGFQVFPENNRSGTASEGHTAVPEILPYGLKHMYPFDFRQQPECIAASDKKKAVIRKVLSGQFFC